MVVGLLNNDWWKLDLDHNNQKDEKVVIGETLLFRHIVLLLSFLFNVRIRSVISISFKTERSTSLLCQSDGQCSSDLPECTKDEGLSPLFIVLIVLSVIALFLLCSNLIIMFRHKEERLVIVGVAWSERYTFTLT